MDFEPFPKIARLNRDIIITEKIDGTNASVWVDEVTGEVRAASRNRFITPENDNFGFAKWVEANKEELRTLGHGVHFGEWWGSGIQRGYGQVRKRFSLFHIRRDFTLPNCCEQVPILFTGPMHSSHIEVALNLLRAGGSRAAPGFMNPEGIVIFHTASHTSFKVTLEGDEKGKSE